MFKIIEMSFVIPRDQSVSELSSFRQLKQKAEDRRLKRRDLQLFLLNECAFTGEVGSHFLIRYFMFRWLPI